MVMIRNSLQVYFEATTRTLLWPTIALALCLGPNVAQARLAALAGSDTKQLLPRTVQLGAAQRKEVPKAGGRKGDRRPNDEKKPRCVDVGGYEAYMKRTGRVCIVGLESYQGPEYRGGR
jgi:hypothetical protein